MYIDLSPLENELLHNLINLILFPECRLMIGQSDRYFLQGAEVVVQRTGNPFDVGKYATTYCYHMDGHGFELCARAIWPDEDEATALVRAVAITPNDESARKSLCEWLQAVVNARKPSRDLFEGLARY